MKDLVIVSISSAEGAISVMADGEIRTKCVYIPECSGWAIDMLVHEVSEARAESRDALESYLRGTFPGKEIYICEDGDISKLG